MRTWRIPIGTVLVLLLGCGPEPASGPDASPRATRSPEIRNSPPRILSATLRPEDPSIQDPIELDLDVRDPDRDALDVSVTWIRNGTVLESGPERRIGPNLLSSGDSLYAQVTVSDGKDSDEYETASVTVRNHGPIVTSVRIRPDVVTAREAVLAEADAQDAEGDDMELLFRWLRNGVEIPGHKGRTLPAGQVKRGDRLSVAVLGRDSWGNEGEEVESPVVRVENAPPEITSKPPATLASPSRYEYQVQAEDADADHPLSYELARGPAGMQLQILSGELVWDIPADAAGAYDVEVVVKDPYGGEAHQRYSLRFETAPPPAAAQ